MKKHAPLTFAARIASFTAHLLGGSSTLSNLCDLFVKRMKVTGGRLDLVTAVEQVAKQNIPAVVHIEVTERKEVDNPFLPFQKDPFLPPLLQSAKEDAQEIQAGNRRPRKRRHHRCSGTHSHQQPFGCGREQDSGGDGQRAVFFRKLCDVWWEQIPRPILQ